MGARPLRRAIQRYIEDPLADEVLRQGEMAPGSTVMVDRDESGDEEDRPLNLTIIRPSRPPKREVEEEPEKVGVGAGKGDGDEPSAEEPSGDSETTSGE
jgi:ATP-dependent Clp protease ATP-binding subunit ClpC